MCSQVKETVLLIHGTFEGKYSSENTDAWYMPGSSYSLRLDKALDEMGSKARCWAHLEDGFELFLWDGENSVESRNSAARSLYSYVQELVNSGWKIHFIAYSHGGNVLLEALDHDIWLNQANGAPWDFGKMVTMGTPITTDLYSSLHELPKGTSYPLISFFVFGTPDVVYFLAQLAIVLIVGFPKIIGLGDKGTLHWWMWLLLIVGAVVTSILAKIAAPFIGMKAMTDSVEEGAIAAALYLGEHLDEIENDDYGEDHDSATLLNISSESDEVYLLLSSATQSKYRWPTPRQHLADVKKSGIKTYLETRSSDTLPKDTIHREFIESGRTTTILAAFAWTSLVIVSMLILNWNTYYRFCIASLVSISLLVRLLSRDLSLELFRFPGIEIYAGIRGISAAISKIFEPIVLWKSHSIVQRKILGMSNVDLHPSKVGVSRRHYRYPSFMRYLPLEKACEYDFVRERENSLKTAIFGHNLNSEKFDDDIFERLAKDVRLVHHSYVSNEFPVSELARFIVKEV